MKVFEAKERQGRYLRDVRLGRSTAPSSSAAAGLGSEGRRHEGSQSVPLFPEKLSTVKNRTAHNCFFNLDFANAVWIDGQNVL